jgi:hypothetical protein
MMYIDRYVILVLIMLPRKRTDHFSYVLPVNNHLVRVVVLIWNLSTCQSANRNLKFRRPGGRSKDSFLCRMKRRSDTCHPFEERRSVSRVIRVRTWSLFTRFHVSTTKWYLRRRPYINVRAAGRNSGTYLFSLAVRILTIDSGS